MSNERTAIAASIEADAPQQKTSSAIGGPAWRPEVLSQSFQNMGVLGELC